MLIEPATGVSRPVTLMVAQMNPPIAIENVPAKNPKQTGATPLHVDFTAAQRFLQTAARQLLARDEFAQRVLKTSGEIQEMMDRDSRHRELYYGLLASMTKSDPLNPELNEVPVNIEKLKKLAFEAALSPEFVAAQF